MLSNKLFTNIDTSYWNNTITWAEWWWNPWVLKKLSIEYSFLSSDEWIDLNSTTIPVKMINWQSVSQNQKTVYLKLLAEHIYLEDRRQSILQVANITISCNAKKHKRNYCSYKSAVHSKSVTSNAPAGKRAVGLHFSMELFNDYNYESTTWNKGTIIPYSRRGYLVTFDNFGS